MPNSLYFNNPSLNIATWPQLVHLEQLPVSMWENPAFLLREETGSKMVKGGWLVSKECHSEQEGWLRGIGSSSHLMEHENIPK